jgi:hypothetical protein
MHAAVSQQPIRHVFNAPARQQAIWMVARDRTLYLMGVYLCSLDCCVVTTVISNF